MITGINNKTFLTTLSHLASSVGNSSPTVKSNGTALPAAASASAKVIFGSQTAEIAAVYSMSPTKISDAAKASTQADSALSGLMQLGLSSEGVSSLSGLGGLLLSNYADNQGDVSQALTSLGLDTNTNFPTKSAVSLNITTQSGSVVHLNLTRQSDGIAVELTTEGGKASDEEAAEIAKLGNAFQSALNGLSEKPPRMDVSGLTQFDSSLIKSVDLKTDLSRGDLSQQSLNFHADDKERWIGYQDNNFSLKMTSDTSNPSLVGTAAEQQAALNAWDSKFDKARRDGHGDSDQMAMLKTAFHALNKTQPKESSKASSPSAIQMGGDGKVQVRGLNDFSLSLTETEKAINPYRMDEKESFAYQASQSTQESTSHDGSLSVKQTLHTHLTASWYQALDPATPLSLNSSKNSQNYLYHTVDNEETNATTFNYNAKGLLTSIGNHTQVNNVETVRKYVLGELVDKTITPEKYERNNLLSMSKDK